MSVRTKLSTGRHWLHVRDKSTACTVDFNLYHIGRLPRPGSLRDKLEEIAPKDAADLVGVVLNARTYGIRLLPVGGGNTFSESWPGRLPAPGYVRHWTM